MALSNVLLLSQVAGYVIALILSLCITVPMSFHQDEFLGHCLLFSTGEWREIDGQLVVNWASQAYCNYSIFVGVILFLASAIQIYRMSVYLYKGTDSSFLSAFTDVVGSLALCAMCFVTAVLITLGFTVWCQNMTLRFPSCEVAAGNQFDKQDGINTSGFYFELGTAQFGAWASWTCWVGLSVFAVLKLVSQHQLRNLRVSMFRERQRLINGGQGPDKEPIPSVSGTAVATIETGNTSSHVEASESVVPVDDFE
ncbi:Transmembrane protein 179 [Frankliniella fusca]|uniref:Transmembrane protein 179 n=1 Tax=Frankliniella fusca TaxID=407009 RepID=A0AAE1HKM6_9NEOP|nr:Transmembrane protein 179 [Frankliniella fusca]